MDWLRRCRASTLARNTGWTFISRVLTACMQAAYFIIIARSLGAAQYGSFMAAVALVGALTPFASFGTGALLIRNTAQRNGRLGESWGNALFATGVFGSGLIVFAVAVARWLLPATAPVATVVFVGISDLLLYRVLELAGQAFQAREQLSATALLQVQMSIARVSAALLLRALFQPTAKSWALLYLLSSAAGAAFAFAYLSVRLGRPGLNLRKLKAELPEGAYFALSGSSQSIYNDVDKTLLARLSTLQAAGVYAASYRILDVAFQPVSSLLAATYARFFQHGVAGVRGTAGFARRLLPLVVAYGSAACVVIFGLAPLVPRIVGPQYAEAVSVLRWLAPLPLIRAIHYFGNDALTGGGQQRVRCALQICVALFNVALNLLLIPAYSWKGAAWASLASDGLLAALAWTSILYLHRKTPAATPASLAARANVEVAQSN